MEDQAARACSLRLASLMPLWKYWSEQAYEVPEMWGQILGSAWIPA